MKLEDQQVRLVQMIWFALFSSLVLYSAIVFFLGRTWAAAAAPLSLSAALGDPIVAAAYGAAAVAFIMGWTLPGRLLQQSRDIAKVRAALIVRWALFESVAIVGLLLAFLKQNGQLYVPALLLSAAGFILSFPSRPRVESMME